ncbi:MAG TPA: GNAT family N-acetyltransferase [Streptosporangiaceae bacterium]|nr:GNAT family N-acetyltransferase [Streptosporangiaceae bacterium]
MRDPGERGQLAAVLAAAAAGRFPPPDGGVTIVPAPSTRDSGVLGFTAHAVIFADAGAAWVTARLPAGDLAAPLSPAFLRALCEHTGREMHTIDILATAPARPGPPGIALAAEPGRCHPRVARALRYRDDVLVWRADGGVIVLGRGIAGRWEVSIEVDPDRRGHGLGRALAAAARHLRPAGTPLWAQISPANAASVRAFLAAGFTPVGAEAHLVRPGR